MGGGVSGGIVVIGRSLGRFIDWYFGNEGRRHFGDLMMNWGAQLENMKWSYFGREEALFAVRMMDRLFGRRIFSVRRVLVVTAATLVTSVFIIITMNLTHIGSFDWFAFLQQSHLLLFVIVIFAFAVSFSVTKLVSLIVAYLLGPGRYINLFGLIFLLLFQYAVLCYWSPAMDFVRFYIVNLVVFPSDPLFLRMPMWVRFEIYYYGIIQSQFHFFSNLAAHGAHLVTPTYICAVLTVHDSDLTPDNFTLHLSAILNLIPNFTKFLLAAIFVCSFFLRTFRMHPIMTVWERLMESEKPFTLVGTGAGAVLAIMWLLC